MLTEKTNKEQILQSYRTVNQFTDQTYFSLKRSVQTRKHEAQLPWTIGGLRYVYRIYLMFVVFSLTSVSGSL